MIYAILIFFLVCIRAQFSIISSHFIFFLGSLGSISKNLGISKNFFSNIKSGKKLWQKKICWVWSFPSTIIILKIVLTQNRVLYCRHYYHSELEMTTGSLGSLQKQSQTKQKYLTTLILMEINTSYLYLLLMEWKFTFKLSFLLPFKMEASYIQVLRGILVKFTGLLLIVLGSIFLKGISACKDRIYIVASYGTNSGIMNCQRTFERLSKK